jgi:parallel beta-helix repeat protein
MEKLIFVFVSLLPVFACHARTITVDDDGIADFNNIQAAINDANDGDVIVVSPGRYTGNGNRDIDFLGKAITVRSIDPNDSAVIAATIIDANGTSSDHHRGFYFHNSEGPNSILAGFTIANGYTNDAGIYCDGTSPTIKNCTMINNRYRGIRCFRSSATIKGCTIADNRGGGLPV